MHQLPCRCTVSLLPRLYSAPQIEGSLFKINILSLNKIVPRNDQCVLAEFGASLEMPHDQDSVHAHHVDCSRRVLTACAHGV